MSKRARDRRRIATYTHCIVCGKEKQIPKHVKRPEWKPNTPKRPHKPKAYADVTEYERDPYCSTACCRKDHGLDSITGPTSG